MSASEKEMGLACVYYPAAGLALGLALTLPPAMGFFAGASWVQAWLYVALSAWLTRALHLDGFADLLDALGSGATGDSFQAVLKDSRMGAFGCAGLVLLLSGQIVMTEYCLHQDRLLPLLCAPVFGRCLPMLLASVAPANPRAVLGKLLAGAPRKAALATAGAGLALPLLFLPPAGFALLLALTAVCLAFLRRIALREGGYNGDFCGFIIVCGESAILLTAAW